MKKLWNKIGWIINTIVGSTILGAAYAIFLAPIGLNAGGISGLSAIIVELFNKDGSIPFMTIGTLTIIINLPLFVIAGMKIGKRFFFGSLLGMFVSSMLMDYFPLHLVLEPLVAALYGGALIGFGVGLVFAAGTSTGGSDIVVRLVKLKARNVNLGQILITFDMFVIALTGLVFGDVEHALYTGIAIFLVGKVMDMVVYGFDNSKTAMIITSKHEEVSQAISEKLHRGTTYLYSQGSYTHKDGKVVLVAVYPKQVAMLKDIVVSIDPYAFVILQEAHQVLGDGFLRHSKDSL